MEDKATRKRARAEIRVLHQQFVTMKRAQADGVEVTDYLEDDASSRRQIQDGESEGGSRSGHSVGSTHTLRSGAIGPPPQSPTTTSDRPSMSSLGNFLHREQILTASPPNSAGSKDWSGEHSATSSPRNPPVTPVTPPARREKTGSLLSIPSSKPLPHRPISMSDINGSTPFSPPGIYHNYARPGSITSQSHHEDELWVQDGTPDAPASLARSSSAKSSIPPIHVTPGASSGCSTLPKSDLQPHKSPLGSGNAVPSIPTEYEYSTISPPAHSDPYYVAHSPRGAKSSSSGDDLVAMLDRVSNKPGPIIAPTAAHTTIAGNDSEKYPGSLRAGVRLHTAGPDEDNSRHGDSGLKNTSIKSPLSESYLLTEDTDLKTQTSLVGIFLSHFTGTWLTLVLPLRIRPSMSMIG